MHSTDDYNDVLLPDIYIFGTHIKKNSETVYKHI